MQLPARPLALLACLALLSGACTDDGDEDAVGTADDQAAAPTTASPSPAPLETEEVVGGGGVFERIPEIVSTVGPSTVTVDIAVQRGARVAQGAASGVIWSPDGVIVTNNHVVEPAEDLSVVLANGERHPAELVAADPRTDLAVLRIDAAGLPAATFAEQLPAVGDLAVALGNPLGFENTATAGIVSGLDRSLPQGQAGPTLVGLVQTDASISSGNSGGALVDDQGRVIGINVAAIGGAAGQSVAENIGFAIPSTTVIGVVEQLLETGEVQHAYLGVRGTTLTPPLAERFNIGPDRGFLVGQAEEGGPADEAGLQQGDVIVGLGGQPVDTFGDMAAALRDFRPGDTVEVTFVRGDEERTVDLVLGELPEAPTP